jgi:H+/Cl- antiporter ClcA
MASDKLAVADAAGASAAFGAPVAGTGVDQNPMLPSYDPLYTVSASSPVLVSTRTASSCPSNFPTHVNDSVFQNRTVVS